MGQLQRALFEHASSGVAQRVDGVAHAVDQAALIAGLLADQFAQEGLHLTVAVVRNAGLDVLQHLADLVVGPAVAEAL